MKKPVGYAAVVIALTAAVLAFIDGAVLAGTFAVLAAALTGYAVVARERP